MKKGRKKKQLLGEAFLNDRGVTLPTIIITAVFALAAAAAGVVIYNVIRNRSESFDEVSDFIQDLSEDQRRALDKASRYFPRLSSDSKIDGAFEGDE